MYSSVFLRVVISVALFLLGSVMLVKVVSAGELTDPLGGLFREITVGMSLDSVEKLILKYRVARSPSDQLYFRFYWRGRGLDFFQFGQDPMSVLTIKIEDDLVRCAYYHFYYDDISDEHRYTGTCYP